ncbi:11106_t:CDS:2, partial [Dentiscutata erythropus]
KNPNQSLYQPAQARDPVKMSKTEYYSEEEEFQCPLCMEEMDLSDRNFRPCPCGYQICRFCWHHIQENLNGLCPACRRVYSEQTIEFKPISAEELARIKNEKKQREREKKELEAMNRKHLSNMRVVQKNLVYVIGLSPKIANEEILRSHDYFGQYGKIAKIVVNRRNPPASTVPSTPPPQPSVGVYITYVRKEDAARAIAAVDGSNSDGKVLRASYGTTKYCTYYLRSMVCQNPNCMYLHEPGEEADSYTKEDLASEHASTEAHKIQLGRPPSSGPTSVFPPPHSTQQHTIKKAEPPPHRIVGPESDRGSNDEREEASALPPTASWATKPSSTETTPILHNQQLPTSQLPHSVQLPLLQSSQNSSFTHTSNSQQSSPTPSSSQEPKTKRLSDAQSINAKVVKKVDYVSMSLSTVKKNETDEDVEAEQPQRFANEPIQVERLEKKSDLSVKSHTDNPLLTKQTDIVADFDQTLSILSDGSFSFSFNGPLPDSASNTEEKLSEKTSTIVQDSSIVASSRIVSPPPGVGFIRADISNLSNTTEFNQPSPTPYTGSFNPFAPDDDKFDPFSSESPSLGVLGISSLGNNTSDAYVNDARTHSQAYSNSTKSRNSSRFGFAQEDGEFTHLNSADPLAMKDVQDSFRALFPNVNISFGPSDVHQESMWNTTNDSTFAPLRRNLMTAPPGVPISNVNQAQNLLNNTSPGLDHHFHQNMLMQHHQQLSGNSVVPPTIKSPPPGIYTQSPRMDYGMTGGWNPPSTSWNIEDDYLSRQPPHQPPHQPSQNQFLSNHSRNEAQDFFGAFLKAAAVNSNSHDEVSNEAEALPNILQDPAIMSVRISQADNAYRAPGAPVMSQQQYQPIQNVGGHRLSVFERVTRTGDEQIGGGFGVGIGLGNMDAGINDDSKEIQTSTPSERTTEIEKETDQSINAALIKSPVFLDKNVVHKKTNNEIGSVNANRSLKPAPVKILSTKTNGGNDLQVKSAASPSSQTYKRSPNENVTRKSDSNITPDSSITTSVQKWNRRNSKSSKKQQSNVDGQLLSANDANNSKHKDALVHKGDSSTSVNDSGETNVKSDIEPSIVPMPILSKKSKKKDKNSSVQAQLMVNDLTLKDTDSIEYAHSLNIGEFQNISNESNNEKDNLVTNNSKRHNKMSTDFKFDFPTSVFSPSTSKDTNNESISTHCVLKNSSDPKSPSDSTFEFSSSNIFSKDFNFNTSSIFNLPTSFSSNSPLFGSSDNNSPGSPIMNGDPSPWNNSTQSSNSNISNGVKTTTVSVEDLERQVANARREAEMLEHRLRAVIKKNTHHLQDAWK